MMKTYYKEYELLIDLPSGEKKGTHFFTSHIISEQIFYKPGTLNSFCDTGWIGIPPNERSVIYESVNMTPNFFKPIGDTYPLYPKFPNKHEIKNMYYLIGENRLNDLIDEIRAINNIFYSDDFYDSVYNLLKDMYNKKYYPNKK